MAITHPESADSTPKASSARTSWIPAPLRSITTGVMIGISTLVPNHGNSSDKPVAKTKVTAPAEQKEPAKAVAPKKELTPEEMEAKLEAIVQNRVNFRRVGDIQKEGHRCVDGRCKCQKGKEVVGGAGGGAGDIAAAVVALKNMKYDLLKGDTMNQVINAHTATIYRHTDTHALHDLEHAIVGDPENGVEGDAVLKTLVKTKDDIRILLERGAPDEESKRHLLALLNERGVGKNGVPRLKYDGCGHEAFMGADPVAYGMTPELFAAYNKAMYEELWREGEHEVIDPLEGDHGEQFVTQITFEGEIEGPDTKIPAISPADEKGEDQIFVFHPQYTAFCMKQYAADLKKVKGFETLDTEEFVAKAVKAASEQFAATGHRLAKGKTLMSVHFKSPTDWEIKKAGTIE